MGAYAYTRPSRVCEMANGTHLEPIDCEGVHVHDVQPAGEAFVERSEGIAETAEVVDVCLEGLCLVDEFGEDGFDEAESMRCIWVLL